MKERIVYKSDSFTDYEGKDHKIIMAAVSRPVNDIIVTTGGKNENGVSFCNLSKSKCIKKVLSIGVAICSPEDKFDENIGMKIAYAKAISDKCLIKLYVLSPGMINTQMVDALINQEISYIKNNPQTCIKGYRDSYNKYLKEKENKRIFNSLTADQKSIVEAYNSLSSAIKDKVKKFFK